MISLLDIGNTRTKYCKVDSSNTRSSVQFLTNNNLTKHFLNNKLCGSTKVILASVADEQLTEVVRSWCLKNNSDFHRVLSEENKNGVTSAYEDPSKLGVDRWLALVGAVKLFPNKNVLIIDSGTATTVDYISGEGKHVGGWILAGLNTLISSVLSETAKVKANKSEIPSLGFGINTSENVNNAAWAATIGTIHLAISELNRLEHVIDEVIITGGNALSISTLLTHQHKVIDDLVFAGLQAYI